MPAESCTTTPAADLPDLDGNANSTNPNVLLCLQLVLLIIVHTIGTTVIRRTSYPFLSPRH